MTGGRRAGADSRSGANYRADLEGLRAVAVLAVVLYHAGVPGLPGGFVGVDVFFVLSGFFITGMLWRAHSGGRRLSLADFYARRIRRLLPMSVLVLMITVAAAMAVLPPLQVRAVLGDARWTALYAGNYRFAVQGTDYLSASRPPSPLQHYWSLGVEEQFYLVWPVLLGTLFWLRRRVRAVAIAVLALIAVASFLLGLRWTDTLPAWAFFSLPSRAWELAVGGLVALIMPRLSLLRPVRLALGWGGLAAVVVAACLLNATTPFPGTAALLPVLGTAAVMSAGGQAMGEPSDARGVGRLLTVRPLPAIGRISYSWYLWHWPVLTLAPYLVDHPVTAVDRAAAVTLGLALAVVSHRLIENPARFSVVLQLPRRALTLGTALTVLGVGTAVIATAALPPDRGAGTATAVSFTAVGATPGTAVVPPTSNAATSKAATLNAVALTAAGPTAAAPTATTVPSTSTMASGTTARSPAPTTTRSTAGRTPSSPSVTTAASPLAGELSQASSLIRTALAVEQVPGNLVPPLDEPDLDEAPPFYNGCLLSWTATAQPDCVSADSGAARSVVLFGDSHAAQWYPAVEAVANQRHWALRTYTRTTCPPLELQIFSPYLGREFTECEGWRRDILARIKAQPPALVILGVARHYTDVYHFLPYDDAWLAGMARMIAEIRATGAEVLVLGPVPKPPADVPTCLSGHLNDQSACDFPRSAAVSDSGIAAERAVAVRAGAAYLDWIPFMCGATTCPVVFGNDLVFRDDNHLTGGFAALMAPVLGTEVGAAVPAT